MGNIICHSEWSEESNEKNIAVGFSQRITELAQTKLDFSPIVCRPAGACDGVQPIRATDISPLCGYYRLTPVGVQY